MNQSNFSNRRKKKQEQALERQTKWDALTPAQKIEALNAKLGVGVGAVKQREKLFLTQFQRHPRQHG